MSRLPSWSLACLIVSTAEATSRAQEEPPPQTAEPATPAIEKAPAPPALTDEARETLELLRSVLEDEGRDATRELLREIVGGLAEPASGEEASHLSFLL